MSVIKVTVEASARHVHLTKEAVDILFGQGYALNNKRELSIRGEYLTNEKVRLEGPRGAIDKVSVLGPERKAVQVEISLTDARVLGITPPIRLSGDTGGSAPVTIVGPAGRIELTEGVMAAKRHIHMNTETAKAAGIENGQTVRVSIGGERGLVFEETVVRIEDRFNDRMHIDIDEANALALNGEATGDVLI